MKRIRVIPALLMQEGGLVKSIRFKDHRYVGDPINAVRIFNEKGVDEIVLLDRSASAGPDLEKIKEIASEAFMPMGYGGGVTRLEQIRDLITGGIEKVVLNTAAYKNPKLVNDAAKYVGSQSIVVSIDVKKNWLGKYKVMIANGSENTGDDPVTFARRMQDEGAGELLLTSIDNDGMFDGYDVNLIHAVASAVTIPVVALGGAATVEHMTDAVKHGASAVAAGSMFVFQRPHRAVLISYPSESELKETLFSHFN